VVFPRGDPEDLQSLDTSTVYPKSLKLFSQYILFPLVLVYFVILYAYLAKILFAWDWPQGLGQQTDTRFHRTGPMDDTRGSNPGANRQPVDQIHIPLVLLRRHAARRHALSGGLAESIGVRNHGGKIRRHRGGDMAVRDRAVFLISKRRTSLSSRRHSLLRRLS